MELYEKIQTGKRVSYKLHTPDTLKMETIDANKVITLMATLTMSMLLSVEQTLESHSRIARELRNTEEAIARLARLNAAPLEPELIDIGLKAWNSAIYEMQRGLA